MGAQVPKPDSNAGLPIKSPSPASPGPKIRSFYNLPKEFFNLDDDTRPEELEEQDIKLNMSTAGNRMLSKAHQQRSTVSSLSESPFSNPRREIPVFSHTNSRFRCITPIHKQFKGQSIKQIMENKLDRPIEVSYQLYKKLSASQNPNKHSNQDGNFSPKSCLRPRCNTKESHFSPQPDKKVQFVPNIIVYSYTTCK